MLLSVLVTALGATYDKEGFIELADAAVVHVPSNNDTLCMVGTTDGQVHFIGRGDGWGVMNITTTLSVNGRVTGAVSDSKGAVYYVTSYENGQRSYLNVIDGWGLVVTAQIEIPGGATDIHYAPPFLYISTKSNFVYSVNATDATSPAVMSSTSICGERITGTDGYLLTACSETPQISIYNMTDNEVYAEIHQITAKNASISDVMYYNGGLYTASEGVFSYVSTSAPGWEESDEWETKWEGVHNKGVIARSNPAGYGTGDVFVSIPGEVKQVDGDDRTISAYVIRETNVTSISIYQQRRLFCISTNSRLDVYSLSKPRDFSPLAVIAVISGAIAVALVLGGIYYYQKTASPQYASDERMSFRGDATRDRQDFNTF